MQRVVYIGTSGTGKSTKVVEAIQQGVPAFDQDWIHSIFWREINPISKEAEKTGNWDEYNQAILVRFMPLLKPKFPYVVVTTTLEEVADRLKTLGWKRRSLNKVFLPREEVSKEAKGL
jgi:hypothetical protein